MTVQGAHPDGLEVAGCSVRRERGEGLSVPSAALEREVVARCQVFGLKGLRRMSWGEFQC